MRVVRWVAAAALAAIGFACGGGGGGDKPITGTTRTPTSVELSASGTITIDDALSTTLTPRLRDASGQEMPLPSGASYGWATSAANVATVSNGTVTAVHPGGPARITVSVTGVSASLSSSVDVMVRQVATAVQLLGTGTRQGATGGAASDSVRVKVVDRHGDAAPGVTVAFAVGANSGSMSPASVSTNAAGIAASAWTLGSAAGAQTASASVAGLSGSPVAFTATATAVAKSIAKSGGDGQTGSVGSPLTDSIAVVVRDDFGNAVGGETVSFVVTAGSGAASPASVITNAQGVAKVQWTLGTTPGPNALRATSTSLAAAPLDFAATATPGAPARLSFVAQPASTMAGSAIGPVQVQIEDAFGNRVTSSSAPVTMSLGANSGSSPFVGTLTKTASNGLATFNDLALHRAGSGYTMVAASGALPIITSAPFSISAAAATSIISNGGDGQTAIAGSSVAIAPSVLVFDAFGNPVSGVAVAFAIASGGGSVGVVATSTNANGVASAGSWTLGTAAGSNTMTATASGLSGSPVTFTATASAGVAASLVFGQQPVSATAHAALTPSPTVTVRDAANNLVTTPVDVTIALTGGAAGAPLAGTLTRTTVNGVATFSGLSIDRAATGYRLTATATGVAAITSSSFDIGAAAPASISFNAGTPATALVGSALASSVTVLDAYGNPVPSIAVVFSITAGGGTVTSTTGATSATGQAAASWTVGNGVGTHTLSASVAGVATPAVVSVTGTAGAAASIAAVFAGSQNATVGTSVGQPPAVLVTDAHGNPVGGVVVAFSVTSGGGSIGVSSATTNGSGVASAGSWTLGATVGTNTVTATAAGLNGSPVLFTATGDPGVASTLAFVQHPSATIAHSAFGQAVTVSVRDGNGNLVATPVNVTLALLGPAGSSLGGTLTRATVNGIATFGDLFIDKAATGYRLTASAGGAATVSSNTFDVGAAAAASVAFAAGTPAMATVGSALSSTVTVLDAYGNPTPSTAVAFAISVGGASITSTSGATNASGQSTASWTLGTLVGTNTLTATVAGVAVPASVSVTGTAAAAKTIALSAGTGQSATVGTSVTTAPSVLVTDPFGNPVAGVTVTFAVSSGGGSLGVTTPTTSATGIASAGSWTLGGTAGANTVTATAAGLTGSPVQFTATGTAGAAATLAFGQQPTSATAHATLSLSPTVSVRDASGNLVSSPVNVTLALLGGPAGAALGGTVTRPTVNGVATFTGLFLDKAAAGYRLTASVTGAAVATSSTFDIAAAAPASVVFGAGTPATSTVGSSVASQVTVLDAYGNPTPSIAVTFSISAGTGSVTSTTGSTNASGISAATWTLGTLIGTNTLNATVSGVATPASVSVTGTPAAAATLVFSTGPAANATSLIAMSSIVVQIKDQFGNLATSSTAPVAVALSGTPAGVTLGGSLAQNASGGVATFTNLTVDKKGSYQLVASSAGLTSATSSAFTIVPGAAATITKQAGDNQTAIAGVAVAIAPKVRVTDAAGNGVPNVTVTFAVASGGGSGTGLVATTDTGGVATAGSWVLGVAGANTLTASATGATTATFAATATAANAVATITGPAATVLEQRTLQLRARRSDNQLVSGA